MNSKLKEILTKVLAKTTPTHEENSHISKFAEKLKSKVEDAAKRMQADIKVRVEGSVAKNTWLKETPEIDIFMHVPPHVPKESLGTVYLKIAQAAIGEAKVFQRFADHPYLEAILEVEGHRTRVNIVPCYQVEKGDWRSATDRTPFHTDYGKSKLNDELCGQIRLLKQFMKGVGVYGAEIKTGGFSGYLSELLVLFHGSFIELLKQASLWKVPTIIDIDSLYEGEEATLNVLFNEPLVVIDPVDKGRNVGSAVRPDRVNEFIGASRALLRKPAMEFFYPKETLPLRYDKLILEIENRGMTLLFIVFRSIKAVSDVLWGQLYKSQRAIRNLLLQHEFHLLREAVWSDEEKWNIILFELDRRRLSPITRHLGPPLDKKEECQHFLNKHLDFPSTISGPRIELGRWIIERRRTCSDAVDLLNSELKNGGRHVGIAEQVSQVIAKELKILVNNEIASLFNESRSFACFLTDYMRGKPKWLSK